MASETELTSDCGDEYITTIAEEHLSHLKKMLADYITTTNDLTAHVRHIRGQPAQLILSFGSKSG